MKKFQMITAILAMFVSFSAMASTGETSLEEETLANWEQTSPKHFESGLTEEQRLEREFAEADKLSAPIKSAKKSNKIAKAKRSARYDRGYFPKR